MAERYELGPYRSQGLVDILDRILDKGLVIAGDIRVNLANVELLTVQIRLLVCSIDKAEEIGMNWWRTDPHFALPEAGPAELESLHAKLDRLAARLDALEAPRLQATKHTQGSEKNDGR
ncbi:MAG: gas vesicle protein [Longimicrobiales bacterium]